VLYECFIDNKVRDGQGGQAFKGGLLSKIRTNETSLFTCVCRALLSGSVGSGINNGPFKLSAAKPPGGIRNNGISRMKALIRDQPVDGNLSPASFITSKAAELLAALKG
jgi:hypothetical protein